MVILALIRIFNEIILTVFGFIGSFVGLPNGTVDELPIIQDSLDVFAETVHGAFQVLPLLEHPYDLFILAIAISIVFIIFDLVMKILQLIRG